MTAANENEGRTMTGVMALMDRIEGMKRDDRARQTGTRVEELRSELRRLAGVGVGAVIALIGLLTTWTLAGVLACVAAFVWAAARGNEVQKELQKLVGEAPK